MEHDCHPAVILEHAAAFTKRAREQDAVFGRSFSLHGVHHGFLAGVGVLTQPAFPEKVHFRIVDIASERWMLLETAATAFVADLHRIAVGAP